MLAAVPTGVQARALREQVPPGVLFEVVPLLERAADERDVVRVLGVGGADDAGVPVGAAAGVDQRELLEAENSYSCNWAFPARRLSL